MVLEFHRHLCEEERLYSLWGTGLTRIGPDMFRIEAGDFIGYPAGGEAHDLRNTNSSHMICIIVGQRLGFDLADYPEQNKRKYWHAGQLRDLICSAAVSHQRLFVDWACISLIARGLMRASARENAHPNVKFVTRAGQAYRRTQFGGRIY